jgi:RimJ/RimL family protein N-acetyltransferase
MPPVAPSIREVVTTDLPVFFDDQCDPVALQMANFSPRDHDEFMAHWATIMADRSGICRTVVVDGEVAGNVASFEHAGRREVGYWLGRSFWGRGVATAALSAFLAVEKTRPLHAGVVAHNAGSVRVLEKCGFVRLGVVDGYVELVLET